MQVARAGEIADPVEPAPQALRRYLNFARLPAPALDIARRVIDEDESFRRRVAANLTEETVGEAGWLWLARPDGWESRLDELRKEHQQREHAAHDAKVEREAQRKLSGAEDRARRAEVALTAKVREAAEARAALAEERTMRVSAQAELTEISSTMDELRTQRNAAVRQLKDVESELAQRTADLRHARHEIRMREAELEQAIAARDAAQQATAAAQLADLPPSSAGNATGNPTGDDPTGSVPQAAPEADVAALLEMRTELATVVAEAAAGAERLSASLVAAAQLLSATEEAADAASATTTPAPSEARPAPRRTPLRLRAGATDDSFEAAEQLLRAPGAMLLVDGYNISHAVWWDQPIATQRERLVGALAELHARMGCEVEVVFDGADVDRAPAVSPRPAIRVRFSPPGVEADDVIIELVAAIPANRPVIVASSDRRVRDGVRRQGANLLGARQLAEALRR
jgi:predicted RNA-binding protein with PIN domain